MTFRFVGTCEVVIDCDPGEFTGMSVPEATEVLQEMLAEEYPEVDVPFDDLVMAADELVTFSCALES